LVFLLVSLALIKQKKKENSLKTDRVVFNYTTLNDPDLGKKCIVEKIDKKLALLASEQQAPNRLVIEDVVGG